MCFWPFGQKALFEKALFSSFAHFFIESLKFRLLSSLYILDINSLSDV
jgi:hypothetical protein